MGNTVAQSEAIALDSLAIPGYLILGEVETPTNGLRNRLESLDNKARIYGKNGRSEHV